MFWVPFPFLRISLFFIAGILLGIYLPDEFSLQHVMVALLISIALYVFVKFIKLQGDEIIAGFLALTSILLLGYFRIVNFTASHSDSHLINVKTPIEFYKARLCGAFEEKGNFWRVEAQAEIVKTQSKWRMATAKILLYFSKKNFNPEYQYGDVLLIKGEPQLVPSPGNPGEFDYKRFLEFKNIYHQHFLNKDDVTYIGHDNGNWLYSLSLAARGWAREVLSRYVSGKQEKAIVYALVLGVSDGLDHDLLNAYASTGTLHVLSVSGLHVSIVYLLILTLFKPFSKRKSGRWVLAIVSILVLWAYAFITGLSPSVLRAVTMFSFMAVAKPLERRSDIYNTLALSALCLLLYDPYLIMSVGFQLSFLAVFGIVYLQPIFYQWWAPQSKVLDEVWKVTSVSIAAQIATFALGLLYFNQFPNYFLISNLFVIPCSFAVLIGGMILLTFSFIQPIAFCVGFLIEWIIRIMNYLIFAIEKFPFSLIENVYINSFQYWLLALAVVFVILLLEKRRYVYFTGTLLLLCLFSAIQWRNFQEHYNSQKIAFYKIPKHTAVDIFDRGHVYIMADSALQSDAAKIKFHITPNRILNRASEIRNINETGCVKDLQGCRVIRWKEKMIVQITSSNAIIPVLNDVDYVLVSNNAIRDLVTIGKYITFKKLIIDSSNSFYLAENLLKQAQQQKSDVHSILHSGALVVNLD